MMILTLVMGLFLTNTVTPQIEHATLAMSADQRRKAFLALIDRPRVPLQVRTTKVRESNNMQLEHFSFASEKNERVTGVCLKNEGFPARRPVVIGLHGTGGSKEAMLDELRLYAAQGFIAVAIDGRFHGERSSSGKGSAEYVAAMLETYRTGKGKPFLYDTVWDLHRLLDYLSQRKDVDAKRIGAFGISKGGMELYLAAATDERIAVVIPFIGVQSFGWALDHNAWQSRAETFQAALDRAAQDEAVAAVDAPFLKRFYDRVVPGIYSTFDGQHMVPLIAPRPLLVVNGDRDPRTPLAGVQLCLENIRAAYAQKRAVQNFEFVLQKDTAHKVTEKSFQTAREWFVRWLRP